MEIQQSPLYASYIRSLGWSVESVEGGQLFIKKFPVFGGFAKLQRTTRLPSIGTLLPLIRAYQINKLSVEPDAGIPQRTFALWINKISPHVSLITTAYLPTKTIRVNLHGSENDIFTRFTQAKRRAVRRAEKNQVAVRTSDRIEDLIRVKNTSAGFLGFITTSCIDKLWSVFAPRHAEILLAYAPRFSLITRHRSIRTLGAVLILFWDNIAYYWIAGATREGKKLFAPTLLVWEALKVSRRRGMKQFDFVGVWDERLPKENHNWKGFTKFKEGFGGKTVYYPISMLRKSI